MKSSRQFTITRDEQVIDETVLDPGTLLNCELRGSDMIFSLTVSEANEGNTSFDKYFLDISALKAVTIGSKSGENVITYQNQFCSPTHAEIIGEGDGAAINDRQSVNGTFVNGRKLTGRRPLQYGDVIYIVGLKIVYLGNVLAVNNPKGTAASTKRALKRSTSSPRALPPKRTSTAATRATSCAPRARSSASTMSSSPSSARPRRTRRASNRCF